MGEEHDIQRKNGSDLRDYLYEPTSLNIKDLKSSFMDKNAEKQFKLLDLVIMVGDPSITPWN